jgi:predicted small metal-binding protein
MESYKFAEVLNEISENASREHEIDMILKNMKK